MIKTLHYFGFYFTIQEQHDQFLVGTDVLGNTKGFLWSDRFRAEFRFAVFCGQIVVSTRSTDRTQNLLGETSVPQNGIGVMNCHPCKYAHQVDWQCGQCKLAFCVPKLQLRYKLQKDLATEDWTCPRCFRICRCSQCTIFYSKNNISLPEDEDGDKAEKTMLEELKKLDDAELVRLRKENEECKRKLEMTEQYVDFLQGFIKINLYRSMLEKEGIDGVQDIMKAYKAAHEEIDDSTDEHVPDGASSALINRVDAVQQKLEKDIDDMDAKIGDDWRVLDRMGVETRTRPKGPEQVNMKVYRIFK